jgi:hypothetical protein
MTSQDDATAWSNTFHHHYEGSTGVIYNCNILITQAAGAICHSFVEDIRNLIQIIQEMMLTTKGNARSLT